ncbi:MAG: signal recognition particle-docking protein FtsY [Betaproteobacteria bacterium]|jgi:fused signal recognition particle receptor|nr:MAG: signal recognition particle-docking protein FtsY [Betaproteobacteria bacterium]
MFSFLKTDEVSELDSAETDEKRPLGERLKQSLAATRARLGKQLKALFVPGRAVDEELYEDLETILLTCDVGVEATNHLVKATRERVKREKISDAAGVRDALRSELSQLLTPLEEALNVHTHKPFVILLAGVNGAGKTTSIGKLTKQLVDASLSVVLAAGDTFRAAAEQQLRVWGERNQVSVIAQEGGDAAAVIFDAIQSAKSKRADVLLADTAGRLPTQQHLMEELKKVKRVIAKAMPGAPHEVLLVIDANTGQNAVNQVKSFDEALGITGLILTKLDGTAKGGAIAGIARYRGIPVRYVGTGEGIDDLRPFDAAMFVDALFA